MDHYVTGAMIRRLREEMRMTQAELAEKLCVSDKTISKWETGRGLPDITLLEPLGQALRVSVAELMCGQASVNRNRASNLLRGKFYICPVCGNVLFAKGEAAVSCCGITLPAMEAEEADAAHDARVERVEDEWYVSISHDMSKTHFITFIAYVTMDRAEIKALYPEGPAEARFFTRGGGWLYYACNRHGLLRKKLPLSGR